MKGVIVAAGYGTRFLPLTKSLPKEMLPLFDKPLIDFILDEFEDAGIEDVVIITSRRKKMMEDYLDREIELETVLARDGKTKLAEIIRPRKMNFVFVRQQEMMGTGHALLLAKPVIGDSPFIVAYPDDIVLSSPGLSRNMAELYRKTGKSILAVRQEKENVSRYGVIEPHTKDNQLYVRKLVEKPKKEEAPSDMVSIGRYLFTPEILNILEEGFKKHTSGEYYHVEAINNLAFRDQILALNTNGIMLDTGEPLSYLASILEYARTKASTAEILDSFFKKYYRK